MTTILKTILAFVLWVFYRLILLVGQMIYQPPPNNPLYTWYFHHVIVAARDWDPDWPLGTEW